MVALLFAQAALVLSIFIDGTSASCGHGTHLARRNTYHGLNARNEIVKRVEVSAFGYLGLTGPTNWNALSVDNTACATSSVQSPIDITAQTATTVAGSSLNITLPNVEATEFENLGSTVEVLMEGKGASMFIEDQKFDLLQFHFHTPSEHTINGEYFPLEMHMVHQAADETIGVLALPFQLSATGDSTALVQSVMASLGEIAEPGNVAELGALDFTALAANLQAQSFSTYTGSLTTPPCAEGLKFFVAQQPLAMDVTTYNAIKSVVGFNARFVQNPPGESNLLTVLAASIPTTATESVGPEHVLELVNVTKPAAEAAAETKKENKQTKSSRVIIISGKK
ncbi:carbonic anhydrase [Phlyctema vagabunda]|uniref:Carbonic anhydrase n=1 Tax=Phlyctema vagabunda TaxID=108571 RepID=A0ABR4P5H4_9HELO